MSAPVEKMIWTAMAIGIWLLSVVPVFAPVAPALQTAAGVVFGAAWLKSVDERRAVRASVAPPKP